MIGLSYPKSTYTMHIPEIHIFRDIYPGIYIPYIPDFHIFHIHIPFTACQNIFFFSKILEQLNVVTGFQFGFVKKTEKTLFNF